MERPGQLAGPPTDGVCDQFATDRVAVERSILAVRTVCINMWKNFCDLRIPGQVTVFEQFHQDRVEIAIPELPLRLPQRRTQPQREPFRFLLWSYREPEAE